MVLTGVGRLGNAPWHAVSPCKRHLLAQRAIAGVTQHAATRLVQHQAGHQVLEHGARPGAQSGLRADGKERPTQRRPVAHRHVALRNGQQAGLARLGRQQVVEAGVKLLFRDAITDMEQVALAVVQKSEIRLPRKAFTVGSQRVETDPVVPGVGGGHTDGQLAARLGHGQQMATEVAAVHGGHIHRQQGRAALGVVPVQEMATMALQSAHRCQSGAQPGDQLGCADPAELPGAGNAEQVQAQIGR